MKYYVYALVRPSDFRPFYIGATHKPTNRASRHRTTYGKDIAFSIVGEFNTWWEAARVETETVQYYRQRGVLLSNDTAYRPYSVNKKLRLRPSARPYPWKRLAPLSDVCANLSHLSEKLAQLAPSEVMRCIGCIHPPEP